MPPVVGLASGTMLPVVRRLVVVLTLSAIAGLLGGCGGANHVRAIATVHTATTSAPTPPATSRPTDTFTKAQAIAFAHAVNLTSADVPGFAATSKREHKSETTTEKRLGGQLRSCTGGALNSHGELAEVSSKDFKLERHPLVLTVKSQVSVARTLDLAAEELAALRSNHVRVCLSHYINSALKYQVLKNQRPGTTINPNTISTRISQGTPPAHGATGSFAWLITASIAVSDIRVPFYLDVLGFVDGPAEVSLMSSGILRPFPATAQEHLYRLLLARAEAHKL